MRIETVEKRGLRGTLVQELATQLVRTPTVMPITYTVQSKTPVGSVPEGLHSLRMDNYL